METLPFEIGETAHALRKAFDRRAVGLGVTRAQWKVLFRLTRTPGLRQVELADMLDIEPITLCGSSTGSRKRAWSSGCADPADRRAWRLHVTAKAQPLVEKLRRSAPSWSPRRLPESTRKTSKSRGRCSRACARMPAASHRNQQGIESMNKMATEPMTGAETAEAPKVKRKRKLPASARRDCARS